MSKEKLEITPEKVREAAAKCSTAAATLKVLFPEAFEESEYDFTVGGRKEFKITTGTSPIYIGTGIAPIGLSGRCLLIDRDYTAELSTHNGIQMIVLKKNG